MVTKLWNPPNESVLLVHFLVWLTHHWSLYRTNRFRAAYLPRFATKLESRFLSRVSSVSKTGIWVLHHVAPKLLAIQKSLSMSPWRVEHFTHFALSTKITARARLPNPKCFQDLLIRLAQPTVVGLDHPLSPSQRWVFHSLVDHNRSFALPWKRYSGSGLTGEDTCDCLAWDN